MFGCPLMPPMFKQPHMSPMLPCASLCSRGFLHVIWGCRGPSLCLDTPHVFGCLPMCQTTPCICMHPVCLYVLWVICMCYRGNISYVGVGGISTSVRLLVCVSTCIGCQLSFNLGLPTMLGQHDVVLLPLLTP